MANRGTAALLIACLLVSAVALAGAVAPLAAPSLVCRNVYGVHERKTCFAVAEAAGLTLKQFLGFNPNVNCQKLFVGQWVCLDATHA